MTDRSLKAAHQEILKQQEDVKHRISLIDSQINRIEGLSTKLGNQIENQKHLTNISLYITIVATVATVSALIISVINLLS